MSSTLQNKKILLGVTGGIAAYKAAHLVRALVKEGAKVRVVMTRSAKQFITPLTLQSLSGSPVHDDLLASEQEAEISHIELARWADLVLVAPATADFMARLSIGMANDLLTTLCLATTSPIALAPSMNQQMWLNKATQRNASKLDERGIMLWGPAAGDQACGETGPGRMQEPDELMQRLTAYFDGGKLHGIKAMVTAGPTREAIDPVRFIGNRSSGRMGYALAEALRDQGAEVMLISGPVALEKPDGIDRIGVETALEMEAAVMSHIEACDLFVGVAAVADYRPSTSARQKIKKVDEALSIELVRNPDILAQVAALDEAPFTVGFAAETQQVETYAEAKRRAKGLDMIAANQVGADKGGFEREQNALLLLWEGGRRELPMMPKPELAKQLAAIVAERYHAQNTT